MMLNTAQVKVKQSRKNKSINLFISGIILLPIYIKFMSVLSSILSFPTAVTTYIYYGVLWIFILLSISEIINHLTKKVIFGLLGGFILIAFEIIIHPSSKEYIFAGDLFSLVTFQPTALVPAFVFIIIGLSVSDFQNLSTMLHKCARIGIIGAAVTYVIMLMQGIEIHYDDMNTAYSVSLVICILVSQWARHDWIYLIIGIISLFMAGTRGPILCVILAILFKCIIFEHNAKKKLLGLVLCVTAGVLIYSGIGIKLLTLLSRFLSKFGMKDLRILDYINNGMLLDSSGRDNFADLLIQAIKEHPIAGYGVGGDRLLLNGAYSHNLIYEVFISFGVFFGGIFLAWIVFLLYRVLKSPDMDARKIGIGLFCGIVVKLFLSSSFIISKEFFIFLGLCIALNSVRKNKSAKGTDKDECTE